MSEDRHQRTIREIRLEKQISMQKIADAVGVTFGAVRGWEILRFRPSDEKLQAVADFLEVPVAHIKIADKRMTGFPAGSRFVNGRLVRPGEKGWY